MFPDQILSVKKNVKGMVVVIHLTNSSIFYYNDSFLASQYLGSGILFRVGV